MCQKIGLPAGLGGAMKVIKCPCGNQLTLSSMPERPFLECSQCGRRVPVHCDPSDFLNRCPRCGKYMERRDLGVHSLACSCEASGPS